MTSNNLFTNRLPESRLGQFHSTLDSFRQASQHVPSRSKEFTLVVVTDSPARILLGLKNRGFGMGMYNSFGGKFDHPEESVEDCACRELLEETNISIPVEEMKKQKVGIQRYTFENDPVEMIMHVFRILLKDDHDHKIRPCEEISPEWFEDWYRIPLDNMFADDSHWLTALLSSDKPIEINGWYHFRENCQETNTILHYHMITQPKKSFSLEQRLFHAIHDNQIHSPSVKEFKECFAFCNSVRASFKSRTKNPFDIVIDVAGGHGALAAMFLICTSAYKAVVVDPARVGKQSVERAWKDFYHGKTLSYREECLRTGLPAELREALAVTSPDRVLVVACHACQHLSEETLDIACRQFGVHAAVMPCCQKDLSPGYTWKSTSKTLSIPVEKVMDLLLSGKMMSLRSHDVRMKCIDSKITPQNRIIICRALSTQPSERQAELERAHAKLETAYRRAHATTSRKRRQKQQTDFSDYFAGAPNALYMAVGFTTGMFTALSFGRR